MKNKIAVIVAALALAFTISTPATAQSVAPVTLTAPPVPRPLEQIAPVKLDAAHSAAFLSALAAVVTLPANTVPVSGGYRVNTDGTVTVFGAVKATEPVTTQ